MKLAFVVLSTIPAVVCGVIFMLLVTRTTLNVQSFMGAIMAIGVAVANAILLIIFAEEHRRAGNTSSAAAIRGAQTRMRPILMTSMAMIAGMISHGFGNRGGSPADGASRTGRDRWIVVCYRRDSAGSASGVFHGSGTSGSEIAITRS